MKAQGADLIKHYRDLAFMGFVEVVLNLRTIERVKRYDLIGEMLTVSSVPVVLLFFGCMRLRKDHFAKGILMAYLLMAVVLFCFKDW